MLNSSSANQPGTPRLSSLTDCCIPLTFKLSSFSFFFYSCFRSILPCFVFLFFFFFFSKLASYSAPTCPRMHFLEFVSLQPSEGVEFPLPPQSPPFFWHFPQRLHSLWGSEEALPQPTNHVAHWVSRLKAGCCHCAIWIHVARFLFCKGRLLYWHFCSVYF